MEGGDEGQRRWAQRRRLAVVLLFLTKNYKRRLLLCLALDFSFSQSRDISPPSTRCCTTRRPTVWRTTRT